MNSVSSSIALLIFAGSISARQNIELSIQEVSRGGQKIDVSVLVKNNFTDSGSLNLKEVKISSLKTMAMGAWFQSSNNASKQPFDACFSRGDGFHLIAPGASSVLRFQVPISERRFSDSLKVEVSVADFFIRETLKCSKNEIGGRRLNLAASEKVSAIVVFRKTKAFGEIINPGDWRFHADADSL